MNSLPISAAFAGRDNQSAICRIGSVFFISAISLSGSRKWTSINCAIFSAARFWLFGSSAVCGIGNPRGRRKSASTANQSASPPTIPASAIARTRTTQPGGTSNRNVAAKVAVNPARIPVAVRRTLRLASRGCLRSIGVVPIMGPAVALPKSPDCVPQRHSGLWVFPHPVIPVSPWHRRQPPQATASTCAFNRVRAARNSASIRATRSATGTTSCTAPIPCPDPQI